MLGWRTRSGDCHVLIWVAWPGASKAQMSSQPGYTWKQQNTWRRKYSTAWQEGQRNAWGNLGALFLILPRPLPRQLHCGERAKHRAELIAQPYSFSPWGRSKARTCPEEGSFLDVLSPWTTILTELWQPGLPVFWNMKILKTPFAFFPGSGTAVLPGGCRSPPTLKWEF